MWPEHQWPLDVARMRELNFNIVRLFEFAWHRLEPTEGTFDFTWAHRVLDLCHSAGIGVIIGTPTAAPPAWLTAARPEILRTTADGKRVTHGQRKHYSVYSKRYRQDCARIVHAMAAELASHPAVVGWQIDNEMDGQDFSREAVDGFHRWLAGKFGTIEALNHAWGLEFWSQAYDRFEQIPLPPTQAGGAEVQERHHPSLILAGMRYNNEAWTSFIAEQCEIVRKYSNAPISSNMTPGLHMDWFSHNQSLDRVGASIYRDLDHYEWTLATFDRMRAEKPHPFWLLETSPSWSAAGRIWNIHHSGAGITAFSWLTLLAGGDTILYWQWRQHWAGQEMLHGVLVNSPGKWSVTALPLGEFARAAAEQAAWLAAHPAAPARVAIMLSPENAWGICIDPVDDDMRYDVRWRDDFYLPLARRHLWRDVIGPGADLSRYRVLILPLMPMLSNALRDRLKDWVRAGGTLILGPSCGHRSEQFTAFTDRELGGLEELIGAEVVQEFSVHWVETSAVLRFESGKDASIKGLCVGFSPKSAQAVARFAGGYGDGLAGVVKNHFGRGTVITVGARMDPAVYADLVAGAASNVGIKPMAGGSSGVAVLPRADRFGGIAGYGVVNLTESPQRIQLPAGGIDRLSGEVVSADLQLKPLQVLLVEL